MATAKELLLEQQPTLGFRFGVFFIPINHAFPHLTDFRFKRVAGIKSEITLETVEEGGENLFSHRLPKKVQYDNLVLERGMPVFSTLGIDFNNTMSRFKFSRFNVLVSLLNEGGVPQSSWMFVNAYPASWSISDLDAANNEIGVETMELAYQRMQTIRL